jgi:enoyl-CoA hydratase/carnithine racemase
MEHIVRQSVNQAESEWPASIVGSARRRGDYVRVGLVPGAGGAHSLPRLVGTAKALVLFFTGDFVDAEEALRIGLVNGVHDDAGLMPAIVALARKIAEAPPLTLSLIERAVYQGMRNDVRTNLDLIASHYAVVAATPEHREAVQACIGGRDKT